MTKVTFRSRLLGALSAAVLCTVSGAGYSSPAAEPSLQLPPKLSGAASAWTDLWSNKERRKAILVEFRKPVSSVAAVGDSDDATAADQALSTAIHARQDAIIGSLVPPGGEISGLLANDDYGIKRLDYFPLFAMEATGEEIEKLATNPLVIRIYEDLPHEPKLATGLSIIGMPLAYTQGATGAGFNVAVLDTGVRKTHDFLRGKVVAEACFSTRRMVTVPTGGFGEYIPRCPGESTQMIGLGAADDCDKSVSVPGCGHGTMVAGIAAGFNTGTAMPGIPSSGVARASNIISVNVSSYAVRIPGSGNGPPIDHEWVGCSAVGCVRALSSDVARGLNHVYGLRNTMRIAAVSVSFGRGSHAAACNDSPLKTIIDGLRAAKIATIVPAGDDALDDSVSSPGCITSAVTVAGSVGSTTRQSFSNWGNLVDLVAPSSGLNFPVPRNNTNSDYQPGSGTSLATAYVAGAFAAIRSRYPNAEVGDIEDALQLTGYPITSADVTRARIYVPDAVSLLSGAPQRSTIVAATTPLARATRVGNVVTAYATILNIGNTTARQCRIALPAGIAAGMSYRTRSQANVLGGLNVPADILRQSRQDFLLTFVPTAPMAREILLRFICDNTDAAPVVRGVNSFLLTAAQGTSPADIIATGVTASQDGIMNIPLGGTGFAAFAAINIGSSANNLQARLSANPIGQTVIANPPVTLLVCRTNATGACMSPPTSDRVNFSLNVDQMATFTGFVVSNGTEIPFDPANYRAHMHFYQGSTPVGSASVAVRTVTGGGNALSTVALE